MRMKKSIAFLTTAVLAVSSMGFTAFAGDAAPAEDGDYSATTTVYYNGKYESGTLSMAANLFMDTSDITINGDTADVKMYVVNPIPAYTGWDGAPISDVIISSIDGETSVEGTVTYEENVEDRVIRVTGEVGSNIFGVNSYSAYSCEVLSFTIPVSMLDDDYINVEAYVAHVMESTNNFDIAFTNYADPVGDVAASVQTVPVTAKMVAAPTYSVTIPEAIDLGDIVLGEMITVPYEVAVVADSIADGKEIRVSTSNLSYMTLGGVAITEAGNNAFELYNTLNFDLFGTQTYIDRTTTESVTWDGSLIYYTSASLAEGDYSSSIDFSITYMDVVTD